MILYDNLSNSDENVVDKVQLITGKPITFIRGDIRDRDAVLSCLKTFEIDAVIHFAGLKAVGESTESPLKYFENNVSGSINLFSCMHKTGIKNLIFAAVLRFMGNQKALRYLRRILSVRSHLTALRNCKLKIYSQTCRHLIQHGKLYVCDILIPLALIHLVLSVKALQICQTILCRSS